MPRPQAEERTILLDARAMSRALQRMAVEIVELAHGTGDLVLIGIQRRGVELAERIAKLIEKEEGAAAAIPRGALDITLYRDDLETVGPKPVIGETHIPGDLTDKHVVIVDDELFTGRTARAALDELADFDARNASRCACWWTAAVANFRFRPISSGSRSRREAGIASTCRSKSGTAGTRW